MTVHVDLGGKKRQRDVVRNGDVVLELRSPNI